MASGGGSTISLKGPAGSLSMAIPAGADAKTDDGADAPTPAKPQVVTVAWKSIDGHFTLNGGGDKTKSRFELNGFTVGVSTVRLVAGVLSYTGDHTKNVDGGWWLPVGTSSFKLDRLDVFTDAGSATSAPAFSLAGFDADGKQEIADGLVALSAKLTVKTLTRRRRDAGADRLRLRRVAPRRQGSARADRNQLRAGAEGLPGAGGRPGPAGKNGRADDLDEGPAREKPRTAPQPPGGDLEWQAGQPEGRGPGSVGITPADLRAPDPTALLQKASAEGEARIDDGFIDVAAGVAAKRMVLAQHKATATQAAVPPELFQRMAQAQSEADQQAAMAAITSAQTKATAGLTDAKLLADPAVQTEIKTTTADNIQKVPHASR